MDDKTALGFNTICNFIRDLNASFGAKQKSLMLYGHLIEKTGLIHIEPVKKHIGIFQTFVMENEEAIMERNKKKIKTGRIVYSDRVAIDMTSILQSSDREEEAIIWNHLLTISAILIPESKAKQVLKDIKNKPAAASSGMEDNFLKNIMDKIGEQVQSSASSGDDLNPMQMIGSMMNSGVFNEIFQGLSSGMSDGNMDIGKMMGSMQGLMSNLSTMVQETQQKMEASTPTPSSSTTSATTSEAAEVITTSPISSDSGNGEIPTLEEK